MPLVSIVTPVFNSGKYLKATINSVINQSFQDWEFLIIDGGSTDTSLEICHRYSSMDSRIKLIINKNDKGPAHARCMGIRKAVGEYIAFLDADDIWLPNKLELQITEMKKRNLFFTYSLCRELQKNNKTVSIILPTSKEFSFCSYLGKRGIYTLTVVIRKEILTEDIISIWNRDSYDDTLWWLLIMKKGFNAILIPKDLALYRLSENQLSSRRFYTIKRVYGIYSHFSEIDFFKRNYFYFSYLLNSALRHLRLKLMPKVELNIYIKNILT